MRTLKFVQINKENQAEHPELQQLWIDFISEVERNRGEQPSPEDEKILDLIRLIGIQGRRADMHFEMCFLKDTMIGFANFAIDLGTVYGLLEAGCGTDMG